LLEPTLRSEEEPDDFAIDLGYCPLHAGGGVESISELYAWQHIRDLAQSLSKDSQLLLVIHN
jgi:hypothetical protein